MKNHLFQTLFNDSNSNSFKLNAYFEEECFHLTLLECLQAWTTTVTVDVLKKWSSQHDMPLQDFYEKLKKCLSEPPEEVHFSLDTSSFLIHHVINTGKQIKIKFFQCNIQQADYRKTVECLLDDFYTDSKDLQDRISVLETENELLLKNSTESNDKLEQFVASQKAEEDELFRNFVLVLNEKKKKIQHLYELLEAFKKGRSPIYPTFTTKRGKKIKIDNAKSTGNVKSKSTETKRKEVSDSEDEEVNVNKKFKTKREEVSDSDEDNENVIEKVQTKREEVSDSDEGNGNFDYNTDEDKKNSSDEERPSTSKCFNFGTPKEKLLSQENLAKPGTSKGTDALQVGVTKILCSSTFTDENDDDDISSSLGMRPKRLKRGPSDDLFQKESSASESSKKPTGINDFEKTENKEQALSSYSIDTQDLLDML